MKGFKVCWSNNKNKTAFSFEYFLQEDIAEHFADLKATRFKVVWAERVTLNRCQMCNKLTEDDICLKCDKLDADFNIMMKEGKA